MAQVSGVRRVRVHDVSDGGPFELELGTVEAGGALYALHETRCVDTPRVRLALADGEDAEAALRDLPGVLVRDVRVLWTVEAADGVLDAAPAWRLTLGADDDVVPLVALLAGEAAAAETDAETEVEAEVAPDVTPVETAAPAPVEPEVVEAVAEPLVEPLVEAVPEMPSVPLLEPAPDRPAPVLAVVPAATPVVPLVPAAPEPVAVEPLVLVPVDEPVVVDDAAEEAPVEEAADEQAPVAEAVVEPVVEEPEIVAAVEAVAIDEPSPFALPEEVAFPEEAVEAGAEVQETEVEDADVEDADVEPVQPVAVVAGAEQADEPAGPVAEAEDAAVVEDEADAGPDPRDEQWAAVAAVLAAGRPVCTGGDADGSCTLPADVVWQNEHGPSWACAWHWPTTMAGYPGAAVGAVHADAVWTTWRDGDAVDLARRAADLFTDVARDTGKPVARRLVAMDTLDGLLAQLPEDVRGAVLLWAVAVTNPEWEPDAVAAHSATTLATAAAEGRAVAWPSEMFFQEKAAPAPIAPAGSASDEEPVVEEEPAVDGEKLFQQGNAAAATGDLRAASRLWTEAAEKADHAAAMRALGDLATERDELKTAEEWYGRAAFLNDASSMTRIGVIYLQKGQSDRAAEWLRRAARFGDEEAVTHLQGLVPA